MKLGAVYEYSWEVDFFVFCLCAFDEIPANSYVLRLANN